MINHAFVLLGGLALIAICMFYPLLRGPYDAMAVTLSVMARLFGMAGLVLVPLGVIWLIDELRGRAGDGGSTGTSRATWFGPASIAASTLVVIVVSLGALVDHHPSLGLAVLGLWVYTATRLASRLMARRRAAPRTFNPGPLYLIVWPLVAAALEFTLVGPALESSRTRAIDGSARLIGDIERYRDRHGRYPASLQSLWDDYRAPLVGIRRYHYEPNGDAFNLYFEHFARALDMKEIVMYNPRDEQDFSSHNADLLEWSPSAITLRRGHVAVRDAARPHWKYFLFD